MKDISPQTWHSEIHANRLCSNCRILKSNNNNNSLLWRLHSQEPELRYATKRIIKHNREQGRAKVIIRTRDNRRFMVEMQFICCLCFEVFFRKIVIVSDVLKVMWSSYIVRTYLFLIFFGK